MASLSGFTVAALPVSRNDAGWGPTQFPEEFVGIPYEDFDKGARLGRVADFTAQQQPWLAQRSVLFSCVEKGLPWLTPRRRATSSSSANKTSNIDLCNSCATEKDVAATSSPAGEDTEKTI